MSRLSITLSPVTKYYRVTISHVSRTNGNRFIANVTSHVTGDTLISDERSL